MPDNARSAERVATVQQTERGPEELLRDRQLLLVTNRQPYRHVNGEDGIVVDRPTGGLTAGLDPVMQRIGGTWIAWGDGERDRDVVDEDDCVAVPPDDPGYALKRIWLSETQVQGYYFGFSNQVLWPLCHAALTRVRCEPGFWERYREVNEVFADAVVEQASERPLVWFQDYHLALAPELARKRLPQTATLVHFWHIPWPAWDTFRAAPNRRALLEGLLGNDQLGFHVPRYRTNFLDCVEAALEDAIVDWEAGTVTYGGHRTIVRVNPMGVPVDRIEDGADSSAAQAAWRAYRRAEDIPADARIVIGVDRLDYTKGIAARLRALERLWETDTDWRGSVTHLQIGSESRSEIREYRDVQERVAAHVDRINERFGTDDWQPIVYVTDYVSRDKLYSLYRHADLGIVSPLRDGMNLVAQEYVAAQVDGDGVLVLSDQSGVHDELGPHVVSVRPADTEDFADAIADALTMAPEERRERMALLREWVSAHDLDTWMERGIRQGITATRGESHSVSMP